MDVGLWSGSLLRVAACFAQAVLYIASLYVWNSPFNRDHPSTIKRRFISALSMMVISPFFVYFFSSGTLLNKVSFCHLLGLRLDGLLNAVVVPLLLTSVLFLGPIAMALHALSPRQVITYPSLFLPDVCNIFWLRNHVVAPLSEEFTFRACMMPLLLQSFSPMTSIFFCPIPFGVAHFHHMIERIYTGVPFKNAFLLSMFQFCYTTVFGIYSAFLFYRTGHIVAPFIVHAFCNLMGFPDIAGLMALEKPLKTKMLSLLVGGLVAWTVLLVPLTSPALYENQFVWTQVDS
ncbi:CAAX prenyl protease 2 [Cloeon dipterum]|uniref:CAAX prenyl protease 2 n=1 Tax=Cloeon dipterum TaxID=197152 RepID=UPI0032201624